MTPLTEAEKDICYRIALGSTSKEIAMVHMASENEIVRARRRIFQKVGAVSMGNLIHILHRNEIFKDMHFPDLAYRFQPDKLQKRAASKSATSEVAVRNAG